jgi:glutamine---fructose-6-phosphate transaminase (isomerizing)
MCGIFGIALQRKAKISRSEFHILLKNLFLLSESRGKESAGLHLYLPDASKAWTIKGARPASELIKLTEFRQTLSSALEMAYASDDTETSQSIVAIAHSRLVTNGTAEEPQNNQPVRWGDVTVIHNGIIVNIDRLWQTNPKLIRNSNVDTEILSALIANAMNVQFDPIFATQKTYAAIEGAASIAWVHSCGKNLVLASNTGDLYRANLSQDRGLVFASERFILEKALQRTGQLSHVLPINAGSGLSLYLSDLGESKEFLLDEIANASNSVGLRLEISASQHDVIIEEPNSVITTIIQTANISLLRYNEQTMRELKRCTQCVLPETFPFIKFDNHGICNYCKNYSPKYKNLEPDIAKHNFIKLLDKYRHTDGSPDVLVPFSGGRDSCYGLHLIKNEFGLNPITFTYDWGMLTDLARRNISRMCGKLGVQNILVSADIKTKRENIRKNVLAWLQKPDLGMVPIFMAGDKHFYNILGELKKKTGINLNIWSANILENTDFKTGLCGVKPKRDKIRIDYLSMIEKFQLFTYYGVGFLKNPGMLNSSLIDTLTGFLSYYFEPRKDFISLFHHIAWDEREVNDVILNKYDFEVATDTNSTWRIGDGTAPFYNYIYMMANGFTEFDTFRSNQIREGQITREAALDFILKENRPRAQGLRLYLELIGLDFNSVITAINKLDLRRLHV